jgi:polyisoprenyl-teichoic acid--peptidoglycan teichoic acid transferase
MLDASTITVTAFAHASRKRRVRRAIISLIVFLLLLTVGTGATYSAFTNPPERTRIKQEALLPPADAILTAGETVPTRGAAASGAENILLIGSDTLGNVTKASTDIIVWAHVSSDRKTVHLVHFPGNLWVNVPGRGKDKISAAFKYGGPPLLVRTLQMLVDVPLDHVAVVTSAGLSGMTDVLGGLDVNAERASSGRGYSTVHKGVNHFDGAAALGFVRERRLPGESDISRGRRQLAFIKALLLKSLTTDTLANRIRSAEFMEVVVHGLTVDNAFSSDEMRSLTTSLKGLVAKNVVSITAPITGFGKSPKGAVDVVNAPRMALLSIALKRDDMAGFPLR